MKRGDKHRELCEALAAADLPVDQYEDLRPVLWGKLVLNLNNAVNALSGLPLKQQLETGAYRKVLVASIREANQVLKTAGIRPAKLGKTDPKILPFIMGIPDWLFRRLSPLILKVDDKATSSMQEDLRAHKKTEVDFLNGEVVALAAAHGSEAPINARIVELIKQAEAADEGSPNMSTAALMTAVLLQDKN